MQKCGFLAALNGERKREIERAKRLAVAPEVTDELRAYARSYFPEITDEQIMKNYIVLQCLCSNERDKWTKFRDGTAQEILPMIPIMDKYTGEIRPAYKEA